MTTQKRVDTPVKFAVKPSPEFSDWLDEFKISLAFSTYQTGKLFFIGLNQGRLSIFERNYQRCMGLCATADAETIFMSTLYQVWRLGNVLGPGQRFQGYDRLYVPRLAYTTGNLDVHDMALEKTGRPVFINTRFSCLATVSEEHSFTMLWKPPFIGEPAPDDRCHLNGLAMKDGVPRYVTLVGESNEKEGWRKMRRNGGMVLDITTDEVIVAGLSMPHSPRTHQDKLWLHDSGNGDFGYVDDGRFVPLTACPGYLRGLSFIGDYAVVGLSLPRNNKTFQDLALDSRLPRLGGPRCGLQVIDIRSGEIVHHLYLEGVVEELYDVIVLPQVVRPMALGFKADEIKRMISIG